MNPYFELNFFQFIKVLFIRTWGVAVGQNLTLAEDEVQILILLLLSISCSLVGSFLFLRKMTMFANSISHTVLVGIVISFTVLTGIKNSFSEFEINSQILFFGAIISAGLSYVLVELFHKSFNLQKDAAIGLVFTMLFAMGIILVTLLARHSHIGSEMIMGSLDALDRSELKLQFLLTSTNVLITLLFYRAFIMASFDATFSKNFPLVVPLITTVMVFQTALTSIGAYKVVGALLYLMFLTAPVLAAKVFVKRMKSLLVLSCVISIFVSVMAVAISRAFLSNFDTPLSTGGLCTVLLSLSYPISLSLKKLYQLQFNRKMLKEKRCNEIDFNLIR